MKTLTELAQFYRTDKQTYQHNYMEMYESMLKTINVTSLLEVGLGNGASMRMWRDYYPEASLYCIEYFGDENRINWGSANGSDIKGLTVFAGDSSKEETWKDVPYNLSFIVEDGDHHPVTQVGTFLAGFSHVASKGLYFIEDTHSSIQAAFYQNRHCMIYDWLFDLILKQQEALDWSGNGGNFRMAAGHMTDKLASQIYSYHVYKSVIVFERA